RVVTECEFLAYREGLEEIVLQCRAGSSYFLARSPRSTLKQRNLQAGDKIRLTGIYTVTTTRPMPRTQWADGFRLDLSGDASIEVVRPTPCVDAPTGASSPGDHGCSCSRCFRMELATAQTSRRSGNHHYQSDETRPCEGRASTHCEGIARYPGTRPYRLVDAAWKPLGLTRRW
ncbi:hypothetical protein N9A66_01770, partial [Akkermansiaceae bacterium]|nr:hypothetical protein [Akkermansiaceae bacterium]